MLSDLKKKQQFILFFHVSLGAMIIYPFIARIFINAFNLDALLSSNTINLGFDILIILSTLYLGKDLYLKSWLRFKEQSFYATSLAFKLLPLLMLASLLFNSLAVFITHQEAATNQNLLYELFQTSPVYITFSALTYAPILEEILFRGFFYGLFEKYSKVLALIISGLVFGLAHMYTGQFSLVDLAFLPSYSVLGMIIAYSYLKTKSIFTPMLVHFLNNLVGILVMVYL